jgi:FK506-binding nuclear protein
MCYFKATGPYKIYLTGNFCIPPDVDSDEEDDEDSDEDELDLLPEGLEDMSDSEDEEDELDDLEDPRITEVDDEDQAPKLTKAAETLKKGKNKRPAEEDEPEDDEDEDADMTSEDILKKILKAPAPEEKLSKKQKKKLKNNAGEAVPTTGGAEKDKKPVAKEEKTKEPANKEGPSNGKKVQFAKNLEQGPTPTKASNQAKTGTKNVEGVIIDDRKPGQGKQAKKGDRVELRYIGKLQDGKVFDGKSRQANQTQSRS